MKLVHAADLHLDSPLRGLVRYEGAPVEAIRGATRRAFENLVGCCVEEQADALLLAGDVFDGDWRDYSTGLFFVKQLTVLREHGVRVFLIRGNHDAESKLTKHLSLPANVHEFATRRAETVTIDSLGLAVHGQGYGRRDVVDDLAAAYPDPVPGMFNVGLLHTALDGREGHDSYAPTSVDVLRQKGYDYWALGHVHEREIVATDPWIVFPGNLQGRHIREPGAKGAAIVTVTSESGAIDVQHVALDVLRWFTINVEIDDCETGDDAVALVRRALGALANDAEGRLAAVRVCLSGASDAHRELAADPGRWTEAIRSVALDMDAPSCWIEKVRFATRTPVDLVAVRERLDPIGALARSIDSLRDDDERLVDLASELRRDLGKKLQRKEAMPGRDGDLLEDPAQLREILGDVEQLLLSKLLAEGGA